MSMQKNIRRINPKTHIVPIRKRVAAYARVSSGKDAMLHSLSAQVSYYSDLIQKHPGWQYIGVYADEALTGTNDSRAEFQRMLTDCRAGKIDMIITKSISRMARNTVTMLETVRELKSLNIDVYFEKENIHSLSEDGELMLTILASFAQEESRSVSENCKWRIRKQFQEGELANLRFMYGYRIEKNCIEIDPEQAAIVRLIFSKYINGEGCTDIAKQLCESGVESIRNGVWMTRRVIDILKNEKYAGNALLQKKYVIDHLSKKLVRNNGVLPKYYAENTHPAIIDLDTFQMAQEIMEANKAKNNISQKEKAQYPFTGKIVCANCGKRYKRTRTHKAFAWNCTMLLEQGKSACHAKQIPEDILISITMEVLGLSHFDESVFQSKIKELHVPEPNKVIFVFMDGHIVEQTWQNKSRRDSWSEEARQLAKERADQRKADQQKGNQAITKHNLPIQRSETNEY